MVEIRFGVAALLACLTLSGCGGGMQVGGADCNPAAMPRRWRRTIRWTTTRSTRAAATCSAIGSPCPGLTRRAAPSAPCFGPAAMAGCFGRPLPERTDVQKILIANRGEIACRVIKTAAQSGHRDRGGLFRRRCRGAACPDGRRGGAYRSPPRQQSYIVIDGSSGGEEHPRRGGASGLRLPERAGRFARRWRRPASPSSARRSAPSRRWATRSPRRSSRPGRSLGARLYGADRQYRARGQDRAGSAIR